MFIILNGLLHKYWGLRSFTRAAGIYDSMDFQVFPILDFLPVIFILVHKINKIA